MPALFRDDTASGNVLFDPTVVTWASDDAASGNVLLDPDLSGALAYDDAASSNVVARTDVYPQRLSPDAIVSGDYSGSVTAVQDDPDSPDANWLTAP